jgi:hypothetical protein
MSRIGSYPNIAFTELQKFLVLDPSTSSTSLVLGSDLVAYITPKINSVRAESTRISAENTDYEVGEIIQTSGATVIGDGLATVYLVVAGGAGDFPMINGNDLLTIVGDDGLRSDLISAAAGKGASLVSMEGGPTVENAISQGVISWSGTRTYQIDSFANRAGVLYVCKTADHISATAPESDATNWRLINAADVAYDNAASGLVAETSQAAIDEISNLVNDAVLVTGDQSINGVKTFLSSPIIPASTLADNPTSRQQVFGLDQDYTDLTASRAVNTTYTNTTGKPIYVSITTTNQATAADPALTLTVDGKVVYSYRRGGTFNTQVTLVGLVPSGQTYSASLTNFAIGVWYEFTT